ncbi:MAG TPA: ATPase domain-containing protein [Steroidobacteraceae bacterium]|nr:ATPase domain-containing protein [Steroidobacteraceae bacterium]
MVESVSVAASASLLERCGMGIAGLNDILMGGLPRNHLYLVRGGAGTGKTTLGLQFLLEGQRLGERGLYITLSESEQELGAVAESHGWSLQGIELLGLAQIEGLIRPEAQTTLLHPAEHELGRTLKVIQERVERVRPDRVVIDSLAELRLMAQNPLRFRRQVLALKSFFAQFATTALLLDETQRETDPPVQTLVHGVIELQMRNPEYGPTRRRLSVFKLRGLKYRAGYHDFLITTGGLDVFPRLVASEHRSEFDRKPVPSGLAALDQLLGGGIEPGTSTLITGAAGTGKSSLALQYAVSAALRGELCSFYTFDEAVSTILSRTEGLSMRLQDAIRRGRLNLQQIDPAELTPGEFATIIRRRVEKDGARMVVIDSLNGYLHAMPDERLLTIQLHELLSYMAQRGVATILLLTQHGFIGNVATPVDLSYLADTVIMLRYFEFEGALKKAISVVKKRSGGHEETLRELRLVRGSGIQIGAPLAAFSGVTTGVPSYSGNADTILGGQRR